MSVFDEIALDHKTIEKRYYEGVSRVDIAKEIERPVHQVKRYMIAQGWYMPPVLDTKKELLEALNKFDGNNSEIARYYGCAESTVRYRRKQYGI